jgi:hypothetical protein
MLVLLGPSFDGEGPSIERLAQLTGLLAYDLRSRFKPGCWGVVKALADAEQALALGAELRAEGYPVVVVDRDVALTPERHFVALEGLALEADQMLLRMGERTMAVPYGALLALARGDVGVKAPPARTATSSSSTFRAVVPSAADVAVFRENVQRTVDSYPVGDLHFVTVRWVARIDARHFDFGMLKNPTGAPARDLDSLLDELAERAQLRVDRGSRASSLASFAMTVQRSLTPNPGSRMQREAGSEDRFDLYSRLLAEAELQAVSQLGRRGR